MPAAHHTLLLCLAAAATAVPAAAQERITAYFDVRLRPAGNDVHSWTRDLPQAQLDEFPPYYINRFELATPEDYRIAAGSLVEYHCLGSEPCDIVVFVYECMPCTDTAVLAELLVGLDGFKRSRCAPKFRISATSGLYPMTAYLRTIEAGSTFEVELQQDLDFVVFGITRNTARDCTALLDGHSCTADEVEGHCSWRAGRCVLASCVAKGPQGPGGAGCTKCAQKEIDHL